MAKIFGVSGTAAFGAAMLNIAGWVIDEKCDVEDTTDDVSVITGYKEMSAGLKGWEGSIDYQLDSTKAPVRAGAAGAVTLTAATGYSYTGNVIITSAGTKWAADGKVMILGVKFVGSGALTAPSVGT